MDQPTRGPIVSDYLGAAGLVKAAQAGDGRALWEAVTVLHDLTARYPRDEFFAEKRNELFALIAPRAAAILEAAATPEQSNPRAALSRLRAAVGIAGTGRNVTKAAAARRAGEVAAWSLFHKRVAAAIASGEGMDFPSRAEYCEVAALAGRASTRTTRDWNLPPAPPVEKAPAPEPRRVRRKSPVKPKYLR